MPKTISDHKYLKEEFYRIDSVIEALHSRSVPLKTKECISVEKDDSGYLFFFLVDKEGNLEKISESILGSRWIKIDDISRLSDTINEELDRVADTRDMLLDYFIKNETNGLHIIKN